MIANALVSTWNAECQFLLVKSCISFQALSNPTFSAHTQIWLLLLLNPYAMFVTWHLKIHYLVLLLYTYLQSPCKLLKLMNSLPWLWHHPGYLAQWWAHKAPNEWMNEALDPLQGSFSNSLLSVKLIRKRSSFPTRFLLLASKDLRLEIDSSFPLVTASHSPFSPAPSPTTTTFYCFFCLLVVSQDEKMA